VEQPEHGSGSGGPCPTATLNVMMVSAKAEQDIGPESDQLFIE
jgi:hypothetical protein